MQLVFDAYVIISFFTLGVGLFFVLYLLLNSPYHTSANFFLGLIIITIGLELWNNVLIHSRLIIQFPWFFKLGGQFRLLLCSHLLVYVLIISGKSRKFKLFYLLFYLPFLIDLGFWLPRFMGFSIEDKRVMIRQFFADTRPGPANIWSNLRLVVSRLLLPLLYLLGAQWLLFQYTKGKGLEKNRSNGILRIGLLMMMVYVLLENELLAFFYKTTSHSFIDWTADLLVMGTLLLVISFFVLKQIEIGKRSSSLSEAATHRKSTLSSAQIEKILTKITEVHKEERLYLDPELSQVKLSEKTGINSSYISQAINEGLRMRFTDFVNQYRIEEAKRMLRDPECANLTIEAIGQQSGFRSKSAFYRAFKKETGQSPGDFSSDL